MLPAQQGYDRASSIFSPDGRLYQVEYAIETVKRGAAAIGMKCKDGIIIAVEEKTQKLQIKDVAQKIFQVDDHIGAASAGYIPDARHLIDSARFFSQSTEIQYNEPVEVEAIAKYLADYCQAITQRGAYRPLGVALILGGVVKGEPQLFLTDPSGSYVSYEAVAIGSGSDHVTDFLEKAYKGDLTLDEGAALAVAGVYVSSKDNEETKHIKMACVKKETGLFEMMSEEEVANYAKIAKEKYPHDKN